MKTRWTAVLLVLVALAPRLVGLNQFATWDELFWTHASLRFWRAVQSENWPRTYVIGQPGVVTLWLGSAAVSVKGWQGGEAVWEASRAAGRPRYAADDLATLRAVADEWPTVTSMTALFTALAVGAVFLLLRRLVGTRPALLAGLLLGFDPFFLAHSRVMALDAILASLMTLSLLAWLVYLAVGGRRYLVLAAVLGGLAALQKTTGLFLLGYVGLTLLGRWAVGALPQLRDGLRVTPSLSLVHPMAAPRPPSATPLVETVAGLVKAVALPGLAWTLTAALTYVAVWPAMWTAPAQTLSALYQTLTAYAPTAYDPTFFLGEPTVAPGGLFYPLVALFRVAPLTWLGLAGLAWRAWRREPGFPWRPVGGLLLYALLFGVALSLPAAKFERYLLPALVPLVLAAGVGLGKGGGWVVGGEPEAAGNTQYAIRNTKHALLITLLFLLQTAAVLSFHPHALAWYNPLLGGQAAAARVLPLGWGEGMEEAAHFLAAQPDAATARVATWGAVGLAPWFRGQVVLPEPGHPWRDADYLVVYITDRQRGDPLAQATAGLAPLYVGRVGGLDYVWVYRGPVGAPIH